MGNRKRPATPTMNDWHQDHSRCRFEERYGYDLPLARYRLLCDQLATGVEVPLYTSDQSGRPRMLLRLEGRLVHLVWDRQRKRVVTFLPVMAADRKRVHMIEEERRLYKEARDRGCPHGFGIGPACPGCVEERVRESKRKTA